MMRRLLSIFVLLFLANLVAAAGAQEFLRPEQAFRIELESVTEDALTLRWTIEDGYYLYRDKIGVRVGPNAQMSVGDIELPPGVIKDDPYFGHAELYYDGLTARVPLHAESGLPKRFEVQIEHQGCAEDGICYPPQTLALSVTPAGLSAVDAARPALSPAQSGALTGAAEPATKAARLPEQDRLASLLAGESPAGVLAVFFGAGLLLSFSPCMLPMLPILSSVIVGAEASARRGRGLALSLAYVLPMALAYAALGTAAGLAGANLQAFLQSPWILVPFAGLFVLLALAMFGFYELRLPVALETRLSAASRRLPGGRLASVAGMGLLSALIVGPCMTAPLAGALLYIGRSGDAALGGAALFALGLGMGLPLIVVGTLGARILPKAGPWMRGVQAVFGFLLLAVAIGMLERVLPAPAAVALWGLLLIAVAVVLGALEPLSAGAGPARRLRKVLGVAAGIWSATLIIGAAAGARDPLRPLQFLSEGVVSPASARSESHVPLRGLPAVGTRLEQARDERQPVVVDFYADWCVSCKVIEDKVFGDPEVAAAMQGVLHLRPDVTANDETDRALLAAFDVPGPPTLMFFGADGEERRDLRVIGEIGRDGFLQRLGQTRAEP